MMNLLANLIKAIRPKKVAVCIYVCKSDEHLLAEFYSSPVTKRLVNDKRFELFEVFADGSQNENQIAENRLTLCVEESYANLPRKTFNMISFFSQKSEFDYILKIDVTTLTTAMTNCTPTGGKIISVASLLALIFTPDFLQAYNGYSWITAHRRGAENWAKNKGVIIDYDKVFDTDTLPGFFSGKLWLVNREFAEFMIHEQANTLDTFSKFFPAEDVMIGYMFSQFKKK